MSLPKFDVIRVYVEDICKLALELLHILEIFTTLNCAFASLSKSVKVVKLLEQLSPILTGKLNIVIDCQPKYGLTTLLMSNFCFFIINSETVGKEHLRNPP